ncbi:MAG: hypothetical protein ACNS60_04295 [Candidatus Cyclobacteriaceae bacterium M2_1C_046]
MNINPFYRSPKYQKFHLEPRYYDPVKEEMQEREEQIRRRMAMGNASLNDNPDASEDENFHSSIQGSFTRRRSAPGSSASIMQLIIMLLLAGLIFGYIFIGEMALYVVVLISCVLLYLKMKRKL